MYGYIYKTTNLLTRKIYVGQKKSNEFLGNGYLGSGVILTHCIAKYGKENFYVELIDEAESFDELNKKEIFWIKELDARNPQVGYNLATGGTFGDSGYHDGMRGKHQSTKQKQAVSTYMKNRKVSDETRHKLSVAHRNISHPTHSAETHVCVNNGIQQRFIKKEDLNRLSDEWEYGGLRWTEERKASYKDKYINGSYMYKDNQTRFIPSADIDSYLSKGWQIGRIYMKDRNAAISKGKKGCICINDGIKNYYIKPELLDEYTQKGYSKGYLKRDNSNK